MSDLARMRRIATGALVLMGMLYIMAKSLQQQSAAWAYVAAFAEAAMVGALADWFAVVALFRHPLNLKIPHTAVLPENKARIARGISEFIQHNFLTAEAIVARIAEVGPAGRLREWLLGPDNAERIAALATRVIAFGMTAFDDERVRRFLHAAVAQKLSTTTKRAWHPLTSPTNSRSRPSIACR